MFKLIGGLIIIVCFSFAGLGKSFGLKKRVSNLLEFRAMLEKLRVEIALKNATLPRAVSEIGNKHKNHCFIRWAELIPVMGGQAAFEKSVAETFREYYFNDEDLSAILTLSQTLGRCDLKSQLRQIDCTVTALDNCIRTGKDDISIKSRMFVTGSTLAGIMIVLLFI